MSISLNYYLDKAISNDKLNTILSGEKQSDKKQVKLDLAIPRQIFLYARVSNDRLKISARRKVVQRQWDSEKQRVNPKFYKMGAVELNSYLQKIELRVTQEHEALLLEGSSITKSNIKAIIDELNDVNQPISKDFFDLMEEWIVSSKNKIYHKTGNTIGSDQLRDYRNTLAMIKEFSLSRCQKLNFADINDEFYNSFHDFTTNEKTKSPNTFGKYIKHLKIFLKWANSSDLNSNMEFQKFKVPNIYSKEEIIALNSQELLRVIDISFKSGKIESQLFKIISKDLNRRLDINKFNNHIKKTKIARDYFVGMSSSGAHIGDFYELKISDIKKVNKHSYLEYTRSKTGEKCTGIFYENEKCFMLPTIVQKYHDPKSETIFPKFNQINKYLKYVQMLAKIDKTLSAKVARKTFGSIWYFERDAPIGYIQMMYGHKKEETTRRYLNIEVDQIMDRMYEKLIQ